MNIWSSVTHFLRAMCSLAWLSYSAISSCVFHLLETPKNMMAKSIINLQGFELHWFYAASLPRTPCLLVTTHNNPVKCVLRSDGLDQRKLTVSVISLSVVSLWWKMWRHFCWDSGWGLGDYALGSCDVEELGAVIKPLTDTPRDINRLLFSAWCPICTVIICICLSFSLSDLGYFTISSHTRYHYITFSLTSSFSHQALPLPRRYSF